MRSTWDIFCSVVDNYGDIGVCWRLARQLSSELLQSVRLWVDDPTAFQRINPRVDPAKTSQTLCGVEIRRWDALFPAIEPAQIVIEGFGAKLPERYLAAMAARLPSPVWINLEYLSAEQWVEGCHGMPSPHPRLPLVKHFFFPGFTERTGGLLVENGIVRERDAFQGDANALAAFWHALGIASTSNPALRVSLFSYENAALPGLVEMWSHGNIPVVCVVPAGQALAQLAGITGETLTPGSRIVRGQLAIEGVQFLDIDLYDRLLWACDLNFVRGEDSFVRAQLAGRPLVWQAYPQAENAHLLKAAAFVERYVNGLDNNAASRVLTLNSGWNLQSLDSAQVWPSFIAERAGLATHARSWAAQLIAGGSLAYKLAEFCQHRLE